MARFYRGRDCVAWLDDMGYYAKDIGEFDGIIGQVVQKLLDNNTPVRVVVRDPARLAPGIAEAVDGAKVDGILMDLGVSSLQLDAEEREDIIQLVSGGEPRLVQVDRLHELAVEPDLAGVGADRG